MTNNVLSIEEVATQFATWRSNKQGNESIPEYLWDQVKILLKSNTRRNVLHRLGLSTKQARDKGVLPLPATDNSTINTFIKIPMTSEVINTARSPQPASVTITRGDTQCTFSHPSNEQLQLIINTFLR